MKRISNSCPLSLLKPKSANVLGAVNKPLAAAGKQIQSKASRMETASNEDSSSNPGSPQRSKTRYRTGYTDLKPQVNIQSLCIEVTPSPIQCLDFQVF